MTSSTVSIIVPAYNHERFVSDTLRSIAAQTLAPAQVIVIDDASSDETWNRVEGLSRQLPLRMTIKRHSVNLGLCATLNEGLRLATSEFVCFLASDDTIPECKLQQQVDFLRFHSEMVAVYADMAVMDADGRVLRVDRSIDRKIGVAPTGESRELNLVDVALSRSGGAIQSGLFRFDAVSAIGGFDERLRHEDLDFTLRLLRFGRVGYQCLIGANYRVVPTGLNRRFLEFEQEYDIILEKHRLALESAGVSWRQVAATNQLRRANNRLNTGARFDAAKWSLRAIMNDPLRMDGWLATGRALAPQFIRKVVSRLLRR